MPAAIYKASLLRTPFIYDIRGFYWRMVRYWENKGTHLVIPYINTDWIAVQLRVLQGLLYLINQVRCC